MTGELMNIPNKLVMMRFIFIPFIIIFLYYDSIYTKIAAVLLFIIAMISDQIDGILARKWKQVTKFGGFMDQVSDKVMINLIWVVFLDLRLLPIWIVLLNLFRELVVTGIRGLAIAQGKILKSEKSGKYKAGLQFAVAMVGLLFVAWAYMPNTPIVSYLEPWMMDFLFGLAIITLLVAYEALVEFIYKNWKFITKGA